ncbi:hypothetical protein P7C70_g4938, partial [Phenoliferia sp. Uapishka_3]
MDANGFAIASGQPGHVPGTASVLIPTTIPVSLRPAYLAGDNQARLDLIAAFTVVVAPTQDAINAQVLLALQEIQSTGARVAKEAVEEADKKKGKKVGATLRPGASNAETRKALGTDTSEDPVPGHLHDRIHVRSQHRLDIWIAAEHAYQKTMLAARHFSDSAEDVKRKADLNLSLGFLKGIVIQLHSDAGFPVQRRAAFIYYAEVLARTLGGQSGGYADVTRLDTDVYNYVKEMVNGFQQALFAAAVGSGPRMERTASAPGFAGRIARQRVMHATLAIIATRGNPGTPEASEEVKESDTLRTKGTPSPFHQGGTTKTRTRQPHRESSPPRSPFSAAAQSTEQRIAPAPTRELSLTTRPTTNISSTPLPKSPSALPPNTETTENAPRRTAPSKSAAPSAENPVVVPSSTLTPSTKEMRSDEEIAKEWAQKITSPLISRAWRKLLGVIHPKSAKPYAHFPDAIDGGFDLGIPPSVIINTTRAPKPTRPLTAEEHQGVQRHIVEEQEVGRFSPELRKAAVEAALGPFQTSPMIPVPKKVKPELNPWRIVRHFSSPENGAYPSVNDLLQEYPVALPTYWTPITEFGDIVLNASCEAEALVVDVKDAFRIIPVKAEQRRWTVIQHGLLLIIDVGLVMGLVPSTDIWGSLVDLIRMYLAVVFAAVVMRNWVDDIVHIAEPLTFYTFAALEASLLCEHVAQVSSKKSGEKIGGDVFTRGFTHISPTFSFLCRARSILLALQSLARRWRWRG